MASRDHPLFAAIDAIYAAALDESLWPQAMAGMIDATGSVAATFCVIDGTVPGEAARTPIFTHTNFDDGFIRDYLDHMIEHDPTVQAILRHPDQRIFHDSRLVSESAKNRHAYYDWHSRHSDTRHRIASMASPAPGLRAGLTVHRTRRQGDYDQTALDHVSLLCGHLERALEIGFRLGTLGTLRQVSEDLLDRNPFGILLLDRQGRVLLANAAARRLGAAGDGLRLDSHGFALSRQTDNRLLQAILGRAIAANEPGGAATGNSMQALRPSGKRPYTILAAPLSGELPAMTLFRPAACVIIVDPEDTPPLPEDHLRQLYGLTRSECRLALQIALGADLKGAAETLGIGYQTARTQLSAIFRKTGTGRQGELVRLLLTSNPQLIDI